MTVRAIDPKPLYGARDSPAQLDPMDKERPEGQRVRNGFMLNPPAAMKVAYDSGVRNWFDPALIQKLPVAMKPGDSLVSTISMPKGLVLHAQLRNKIERGVDDSSPIRTAAVLTCVAEPQPADAFRPAFCDRQPTIYLARNLNRELLPTAAATKALPNVEQYIRFTQRPWVGTGFFGFEEPVENMPQYGLEYGRVSGISALLLCTDLSPSRRSRCWSTSSRSALTWAAWSAPAIPAGRAWAATAAGGNCPSSSPACCWATTSLPISTDRFPEASFGEDEQTAYGRLLDRGQGRLRRALGHRRRHRRGP